MSLKRRSSCRRTQGLTAPEILQQYPQRTLEEIHTVLAWYYAHQTEFDKELAEKPRMTNVRSRTSLRRDSDEIRRLLSLVETVTAEEMLNRLEFL